MAMYSTHVMDLEFTCEDGEPYLASYVCVDPSASEKERKRDEGYIWYEWENSGELTFLDDGQIEELKQKGSIKIRGRLTRTDPDFEYGIEGSIEFNQVPVN